MLRPAHPCRVRYYRVRRDEDVGPIVGPHGVVLLVVSRRSLELLWVLKLLKAEKNYHAAFALLDSEPRRIPTAMIRCCHCQDLAQQPTSPQIHLEATCRRLQRYAQPTRHQCSSHSPSPTRPRVVVFWGILPKLDLSSFLRVDLI
ncbi:hypothetical protein ACFX2H_012706 [Malus domestica]